MANPLVSKLFASHQFGALLLASLLGACTGAGNVNNDPPPDQLAQQRLNGGQYQPAATEFLRLAANSEASDAALYRTSAANAFLLAGNFDAGRKALATASGRAGSASQTVLSKLAQARLAAQDGQFEAALAALPPLPRVPVAMRALHAQTRVLSYSVQSAGLELARAHADLGPSLRDPSAATNNRRALWTALSRATTAEFDAAKLPAPDTFSGWIELAELGRRYVGDPASLTGALQVWRARFPSHPGGLEYAQTLVAQTERLARPARHVALMLPLSGGFARAGAAVRDGFVGAWLNANMAPNVRLSIVDTVKQDIVSLYNQATASGADFIVGPLRKAQVNALLTSGSVSVPTLALNTFAPRTSSPPELYQIALSPEQEAAQVAERMWFDGHRNALSIGPDNSWGQRVTNTFASTFSALGGRVLETQLYESEGSDLSAPVKRLLNIDHSEQRVREIKAAVGTQVQSEVRRRQDVEAIFMAGFAVQARALRPQLRFHRASSVPVYATSHVYGGAVNADRDHDLDGVIFGDMPWIIDLSLEGDSLKQALQQSWSHDMAGFSRLFAFGADAMALITRIGNMRAQPGTEHQGYTGTLTVDTSNVVQRNLMWARFVNGVAQNIEGQLPTSTLP